MDQEPTYNGDHSHGNRDSMVMRQETAINLLPLQKIHNYLILACVPFCIAIIIMSTYWGDIFALKDKYTDLDSQWQACLTSADYQYIGLASQLGKATSSLQSCVVGLVMKGTCSIDCALGIKDTCVAAPPPDIPLPSGHFLSGLSFIGVQTVIFASIAHASMRRALQHPSWLISTIALVFWFCFAIFTYYTISPILPVPSSTNATLLMYMYYDKDYSRYKNLSADSENTCEKAFSLTWVYLAFNVFVAFTVFAAGCVGVYADQIRYKSNNRKRYEPLKHTEVPLIIGALAILSYLVQVGSKLATSVASLDAIYNFNNGVGQGKALFFMQNYFPFAQPNLDVSTILGIASFMSVLRGYTIQSISAFRMACVTSLVFAFSTYPAIVGGFEFYFHNDFDNFDSCKNFFLAPDKASAFGYPSDEEARVYCNSFRVALGSSTVFFILLHLLSIACYFMFTQNHDRDSMHHEPLDFEAAALERAARASSASVNNYAGANPMLKVVDAQAVA